MGWPELQAAVHGARARWAAQAAAPRQAQEALLQRILAVQSRSRLGQRLGLAELPDLAHYRQAVPTTTPEALAADVQAVADGDEGRLLGEPVLAFERTGGSTGGARLIPLTASGLACLQQGLYAWLDDLCQSRPALMQGSTYWSISPATRAAQRTASGMPIGLASDAEYFGDAAPHIAQLLAVPPAAAALADIDTWRLVTLQCLLADASLALVSVWSPTFWLELCRHAVLHQDELTSAVATGRWARPAPWPAPAANPARAALLRRALATSPPDWAAVWPQLSLLSCWTHASATPWAQQLAAAFPHVEIQGKGLLATEGLVSIPLCDGGDPVAALMSSVLEFEDEAGRSFAVDEVTEGTEYQVLLTTAAGLLRYRLGDRVRVTGWWHGAPRLRLLGREAGHSDLCGEKLSEAFVMRCWAALARPLASRLVPHIHPAPHYRLMLDAQDHDTASAERLADEMDTALRANPQYAYARDLGQLKPLQAVRVPQLAARLQQAALAQGQRLGDAKPGVLGRLGEPDLMSQAP